MEAAVARAASLAASASSVVVMERSAERQMLEGQAWLILIKE
jgi:hypothetical protein